MLARLVFVLYIKKNLLVKMHLGKRFCSTVKQLMVPCSALSNQTVALNVFREVWK